MPDKFFQGGRAQINASIYGENGELFDPAMVECNVSNVRGGFVITPEKAGEGEYKVVLDLEVGGTWNYTFKSSGGVKSVSEGQFYVTPTGA